jgi:hypothetical protein
MMNGSDYSVKTEALNEFYKNKGKAPEEPKPVDKYGHIKPGKYNLTYPPETTITYFDDPDSSAIHTMKFSAEQPVVFKLNEELKKQGRVYAQIMGTGKNVYMSLDAVFDKDGQPSLNPGADPILTDESEKPKVTVPEVSVSKAPLPCYTDTEDADPSLTLNDSDEISDPSFANYTDDNGVDWVEIVVHGNFYWVHKNALAEFLA